MKTTKKLLVPYFSKFYFYGSYLFPLGLAAGVVLAWFAPVALQWSVIPLIVLLVASLHRISWGKHPRFGAHFTWAMIGLSIPVAVNLFATDNWLGGGFLSVFIVIAVVSRRRFCRALTRLPKL